MLLARQIGPEIYGLYGMTVIAIGLITIITDFGLSAAYIGSEKNTEGHLWLVIVANTCAALIISLLFYKFSVSILNLIDFKISDSVLVIIFLCVLLKGITIGPEAKLQKKLKFKILNIIELGSYFFAYGGVAIVMVYMGYKDLALFVALLLQLLMKLLLSWAVSKPLDEVRYNFEVVKSMFHYGFGLTLGKVANYLSNQGDQILIAKFLGIKAVGYYGRSFQLAIMPINMLGQALDKVLFPVLADFKKTGGDIYFYYIKAIAMVSLFAFPLSLYLYIVGDNVVILLLGNEWGVAAEIFPIMVLSMVFRLSNKITDSFLRAIGYVYQRAVLQWLFVVNITLAVTLTYKAGLFEIVKALFIVGIINSSLLMLLLLKKINESALRVFKIWLEALLLMLPVFIIMHMSSIYLLQINGGFMYIVLMALIWFVLVIAVILLRSKIRFKTDIGIEIDRIKSHKLVFLH